MSSRRVERNAVARGRLLDALPGVFPRMVLTHALLRSWVPHLPRLAVESYWSHHPVRADRLARALALRTGTPEGWAWRPDPAAKAGFREPPAPFRQPGFRLGPGRCCICGQPVFRFGWHRDLWDAGPNARARWHAACVAAWKLWVAPNTQAKMLGRLQHRRCAATGKRLARGAEADHRMPLCDIWRDKRHSPWPTLLAYWGFPNLQALNGPAHRAKSAGETRARRGAVRTDTATSASAGSDDAVAFSP